MNPAVETSRPSEIINLRAWIGHGYQQVCAWVLDGNERATRFYCKHGFSAQAGSQRIFEENGEPLPLTRYGLMLD